MNSNSKHTPGPWSVPHFAQPDVGCQCTYVLSSGYFGCIATIAIANGIGSVADGDNDCPPLEEARANAHLIAAAPELLEALELARGGYADAIDDPEGLAKIDAALAKACGEDSGPPAKTLTKAEAKGESL